MPQMLAACVRRRAGGRSILMIVKIICLVLCALLLFICYRAKFFAEKVLRISEPSEALVFRIKLVTLAVSAVLFICVMLFVK